MKVQEAKLKAQADWLTFIKACGHMYSVPLWWNCCEKRAQKQLMPLCATA